MNLRQAFQVRQEQQATDQGAALRVDAVGVGVSATKDAHPHESLEQIGRLRLYVAGA
jgi:hypothetical protein